MEGFKSGFYTKYKKERKSESTFNQSFFHLTQTFFLIIWNTGPKRQKQSKKVAHTIVPTSQEKSKKQMKSALRQEVSEFNPSGQMSMEQLIKVVLNLQEEIKKLKKDNEKLMHKLNLVGGIEQRLMSLERELSAFWNITLDQNSQSQNQLKKQIEQDNRLEKIEEKLLQQKSKMSKEVIQQ